ncbi:hypothetical protein LCGC14_1107370 [marine sediment metagenome]|uniref:Portal protein n=1 Tax=marine sediment metagenome TaxID=412755 RepID=A0A0F9QE01_9ZZZZ
MSKQFNPQTETQRREGLFRFGQDFNLKNLRFRIDRDNLCYFLIYGLPEEAFGDGFDLVKPGTEEVVDWNDKFQEEAKKHHAEGINAVSLEYEGGESLATFMINKGKLKLWAFPIDQYEIQYEEVTGKIKGGKADIKIANVTGETKITFGSEKSVDNHLELDNVYELLTRPIPELKNKGRPLLQPAWDAIIARYMLISHSAYNVARGGSGIKKQTMKESYLNDASTSIDALLSDASKFGSAHDSILNLVDDAGLPILTTTVEPYTGSLPMAEFNREYLIDIMFSIGIPVAVLQGLTPGELVGALVNESSKFDALEDMGSKFNNFWMWFSRRIAAFIGRNEDFDIKWNSRRDLVTQMIEKLEAFKSITGRTPKPDIVAKMIGLKLEEKDLEEKQEIPALGQPTNGEPKDDIDEETLKPDDED